ncbi:MAG: HigA family addiction module antidote protein [Candidatus Hydrogenedentes bacterium]|nr:HigA family addiction module antidote protein [Candidatus Hydrogenedentota bacterium]
MTEQTRKSKKYLEPVHPGEVLLEEFLKPFGMSQNHLSLQLHVPPRRINEIVLKRRAVTANTALRLAKFFNNSPEFWLGLQMDYDLDLARLKDGPRIQREVRTRPTVA